MSAEVIGVLCVVGGLLSLAFFALAISPIGERLGLTGNEPPADDSDEYGNWGAK